MDPKGGLKALRIVVLVVGLGEFLTSILLLFMPGLYKDLFGLPPDFDTYYIQQIGMFQFLVGSAILMATRQAENPLVGRFAVYFNVVSAVFWVYYLLSRPWQNDFFHFVVVGFLVYHIIMTLILMGVMKRAGIALR